jgi:hypothetical protein
MSFYGAKRRKFRSELTHRLGADEKEILRDGSDTPDKNQTPEAAPSTLGGALT